MTDDLRDELEAVLNTKGFAKTARLILRINETKAWKKWGYRSWGDWVKRDFSSGPGLGKTRTAYLYLQIARRLGSLTDDDLEQIGVGKCMHLARLVEMGNAPDPEWVALAKKATLRSFEAAVRRKELGGGSPIEFGPHLNPPFRGLNYAPTNEQGVVLLFGMISEELGFIVEAVGRSYPDCVAKEMVREKPERYVQTRIEFEYLSSNFDHPPEGADLIVCWENDLGRDAPLRVLELRSKIKQLSPLSPRLMAR